VIKGKSYKICVRYEVNDKRNIGTKLKKKNEEARKKNRNENEII
jgi:hypothetical protein